MMMNDFQVIYHPEKKILSDVDELSLPDWRGPVN